MTTGEAALVLGVTRRTVRAWVERGLLPNVAPFAHEPQVASRIPVEAVERLAARLDHDHPWVRCHGRGCHPARALLRRYPRRRFMHA